MLSHYKILVSCAECTVWVRVSVKNAAVTDGLCFGITPSSVHEMLSAVNFQTTVCFPRFK